MANDISITCIDDLLNLFGLESGFDYKKTLIKFPSSQKAAYFYRVGDSIGVLIPNVQQKSIEERFSNIKIYNIIEVSVGSSIALETKNSNQLDPFAFVAWDFIRPGVNDSNRIQIESDPYSWYEKWKNSVGNVSKTPMVYDVVGELKTLNNLKSKGFDVDWSAESKGVHDIEVNGASYEVKSTKVKTGYRVQISNQFQLNKEMNKPLYLVFVRVENSKNGVSINDLVNEYSKSASPSSVLRMENYLDSIGYGKVKIKERDERFNILEMFKFKVDEEFPKITEESFKGNSLPNGVVKLQYTIELPVSKAEKI